MHSSDLKYRCEITLSNCLMLLLFKALCQILINPLILVQISLKLVGLKCKHFAPSLLQRSLNNPFSSAGTYKLIDFVINYNTGRSRKQRNFLFCTNQYISFASCSGVPVTAQATTPWQTLQLHAATPQSFMYYTFPNHNSIIIIHVILSHVAVLFYKMYLCVFISYKK